MASARRVLPTPPVPVRVSKRISGRASRVQAAATSRSRPRSEVSGTGSGEKSLSPGIRCWRLGGGGAAERRQHVRRGRALLWGLYDADAGSAPPGTLVGSGGYVWTL